MGRDEGLGLLHHLLALPLASSPGVSGDALSGTRDDLLCVRGRSYPPPPPRPSVSLPQSWVMAWFLNSPSAPGLLGFASLVGSEGAVAAEALPCSLLSLLIKFVWALSWVGCVDRWPRVEVQALESEFHLSPNPVLGSGTAHGVSFGAPSPGWDWYPRSCRWGSGGSQVSTRPPHGYLVGLRFQLRAAVPQSPLADCLRLFRCSVVSGSFAMLWIVVLPGSSVHGIFSGKNTGVAYCFLLQGIFLARESNPSLLHCQVDSLPPSHQGRPPSSVDIFKIKLHPLARPGPH